LGEKDVNQRRARHGNGHRDTATHEKEKNDFQHGKTF
jgi:hypothetical protein